MQRIAKELNCDFYRGKQDESITDEHRRQILSSWVMGKNALLVATEALQAGFDYPHIRQIWIIGRPNGITTLQQMAGRAGRDRIPARVDLVVFKTDPVLASNSTDIHLGKNDLNALIKGSNRLLCFREISTSFLDGKPMKCTDDVYNLKCSRCRSDNGLSTVADEVSNAPIIYPPPSLIIPESGQSPVMIGQTRGRALSTSLVLNSPPTLQAAGVAFMKPMHEAKRVRSEQMKEIAERVDEVTESIHQLASNCTFCRLKTQTEADERHNIIQ